MKGSQLPKVKARTLVHEVIHIFWDEDIFDYKNKPAGYRPNYGDAYPPETPLMDVVHAKNMHEARVEAEEERFFLVDHRMVLDAYRQMCQARDLRI